MKFTTLTLLVAATSAIRISQPNGPPKGNPQEQCAQMAGMIYEHCNQGADDRKISLKEARDCGIPKEHEAEFIEVAGKDGAVDEGEFMGACMEHMSGPNLAQKGQPKCKDIGDAIYKACNQGADDGKISLKEARGCGLPKENEAEFKAVAGADGAVDEDEFLAACREHMN